ncbi:hypothetical protein OsJ_19729 [Oryza sativa Japonica Group]|uniref:Uncharacterized protein n=1 Tax=Oryza sativa subsp. japonica TaxID=39947 RepID=B9FLV5_ORYSJ|nr:hypothetical protein OsJ_19729 [Oryza sativa Japonica Group]
MAVAYTSDHRHHHHHHDVVGRLSSLVALCGRGLSRVSRRLLLLDRRCYGGGRSAPAKQDGGGGEAIWQRTILMGERCPATGLRRRRPLRQLRPPHGRPAIRLLPLLLLLLR